MKCKYPLLNETLYGPKKVHLPVTMWAVKPEDILYKEKLPDDAMYFRSKFRNWYLEEDSHPLIKFYDIIFKSDNRPDSLSLPMVTHIIVSPSTYILLSQFSFFHTCYIRHSYLAEAPMKAKLKAFAMYCWDAPEASTSDCIDDDHIYYVTNKEIIHGH